MANKPTYNVHEIIERIDYFEREEMSNLVWLIETEKIRYSPTEYQYIIKLIAERNGEIAIEDQKKKTK